jgi:hypothetical protein
MNPGNMSEKITKSTPTPFTIDYLFGSFTKTNRRVKEINPMALLIKKGRPTPLITRLPNHGNWKV